MDQGQKRALEAVYAAALNPALWERALKEISIAAGGVKTHLLSVDANSTHTRRNLHWGYDPDFVQSWDEHYSRINPWAEGFMSLPIGQPEYFEGMCNRDAIRRSECYADWVLPQDNLIGGGGMVLKRTRSQTMLFGASLAQKQSDALDLPWQRDMLVYGPAVRHALETNGMLLGLGIDILLSDRKLDRGQDRAVLLVDQAGRLIHTNAAADHFLDNGCPFGIGLNSRLQFNDIAVENAIHLALAANARPHVRSLGTGGNLVVRILPLGEQTLDGLSLPPMPHDRRPAAAVLIGREIAREPPLAQFGAAFGLTDAEASISLALADGLTPEEIAAERGVSIHTIRNQIKSALSKTGSRRQAELAATVARHRAGRS